MSNTQENHAEEEHQAIIKTPKQLITVVVLAFILPVVIILMLANYVTRDVSTAPGSGALTTEAIDARLAPIAGFELVDADAPREMLTGEAIYQQVCAACHDAGIAGAPKFADNAAWAPHIAAGMNQMLQIAINGKGAMPPKGGATHLSDFEIHRAVVYMANAAGGTFEEPAEPAAEGEEDAADDAAQAEAPAAQATAAAPAAQTSDQPAPQAATEAAPAAAEAPQAAEQASAPQESAETAEGAGEATTVAAAGGITIRPEADTIGKKIYDTSCFACHTAGVANAPKIGNKQDWAPYIATGMDTMLKIAIQGKGAMPPRGTAMNASDDELQLAIEYMIKDAL